MHFFTQLVEWCAAFNLKTLAEVSDRAVEALQTSGATSHVQALQMVRLQKAILAVGILSLFEAALQDGLDCSDGFREAAEILDREGETVLKERLGDLQLAMNVLKHGRGRSYDALVAKAAALPFRIRLPGERFFYEGDVSEVGMLVDVDDIFVSRCAEVMREVSAVMKRARPESFL
jgi:hypothetical protein